jgi:hypothetical protein
MAALPAAIAPWSDKTCTELSTVVIVEPSVAVKPVLPETLRFVVSTRLFSVFEFDVVELDFVENKSRSPTD